MQDNTNAFDLTKSSYKWSSTLQDKLSSRAVILDSYYGAQQSVPGMVRYPVNLAYTIDNAG